MDAVMQTQKGAGLSPYVIACGQTRLEECPPQGSCGELRTVGWYELELMEDTDGGGVYTDGVFLPARSGDLFFRRPGMRVAGVSAYGCASVIFDAQWDNALCQPYSQPIYRDAPAWQVEHIARRDRQSAGGVSGASGAGAAFLWELPAVIPLPDPQRARGLLKDCFVRYVERDPAFGFYAARVVFELLAALRDAAAGTEGAGGREAVRRAERILQEQYAGPVRLAALADAVGLNPEYLCRLFKRETGQSPIARLLDIRLSHARRLLLTTERPMKEIAVECGFVSETYFYTAFRRREGMAPGEYRRRHKMRL